MCVGRTNGRSAAADVLDLFVSPELAEGFYQEKKKRKKKGMLPIKFAG